MRRYETIVIINPDLSKEEREPLYEKIKVLIPQQGGFLVMFDEWGTQKLAYEIRKKVRGHYLRLDYCGTGELVAEMERSFRIDDRVLKYMTVLLEKDTDVETLKESVMGEDDEAKAEESPSVQEEETPDEEALPDDSDTSEKSEATEEETTQSEEKKEDI